jgi:hypothetical protein
MPEPHRTLGRVLPDGSLTLRNLPFPTGTTVEVALRQSETTDPGEEHELRGQVIAYVDPTEPVAESDWEVLKDG